MLSGGAVARITASRLKELVITDSIQPTEAVRVARNIRVLSIATLIGEAIGRTARGRVGVEPVRLTRDACPFRKRIRFRHAQQTAALRTVCSRYRAE